ncbi:MAG: UDP-N-acetylmuramate dehydrogenase [Actinobacteria bacterium]|nr:UDP-N-acetylmuramate dehydrogenase [Actinomycetota bacterium]
MISHAVSFRLKAHQRGTHRFHRSFPTWRGRSRPRWASTPPPATCPAWSSTSPFSPASSPWCCSAPPGSSRPRDRAGARRAGDRQLTPPAVAAQPGHRRRRDLPLTSGPLEAAPDTDTDRAVLLRDEPLSRHSTFHAGGRSDLLVVESGAALERLAVHGELPDDVSLVLGGGSNVLVSDGGVPGTVLKLRSRRASLGTGLRRADDGNVWLDGAWDWPAVALGATDAGWQGLESMVGIPGTVGGAVVQSIGAYGYELRELVVAARAVDLSTGSVLDLAPTDIGFRYRNTDLKTQAPPRLVVTQVGLRLARGAQHTPRYDQVAVKLGAGGSARTTTYPPPEVARAVLELRASKSMIYRADDSQTWGAGSFFKNPEIGPAQFAVLVEQLAVGPAEVPHWLIAPDVVRLSAGWLVERAGYRRGHRSGNVALCDKHALGIVNATGKASAAEIAGLAGEVRGAVWEAAGVVLDPEPVLVGLELPDPRT